ncbi:hypothetical protein FA13DRAFT_171229 [Coprinellus micaceus]|uniref:Uncharacterized protein n=1 Tax=Coprinellus micaceus TaxID=71717 RepID=A0A4Y7SGN8_COPMI|nr:hypothetical protein FA13DRAFT_171229 [Coprinellus micaceus]
MILSLRRPQSPSADSVLRIDAQPLSFPYRSSTRWSRHSDNSKRLQSPPHRASRLGTPQRAPSASASARDGDNNRARSPSPPFPSTFLEPQHRNRGHLLTRPRTPRRTTPRHSVEVWVYPKTHYYDDGEETGEFEACFPAAISSPSGDHAKTQAHADTEDESCAGTETETLPSWAEARCASQECGCVGRFERRRGRGRSSSVEGQGEREGREGRDGGDEWGGELGGWDGRRGGTGRKRRRDNGGEGDADGQRKLRRTPPPPRSPTPPRTPSIQFQPTPRARHASRGRRAGPSAPLGLGLGLGLFNPRLAVPLPRSPKLPPSPFPAPLLPRRPLHPTPNLAFSHLRASPSPSPSKPPSASVPNLVHERHDVGLSRATARRGSRRGRRLWGRYPVSLS